MIAPAPSRAIRKIISRATREVSPKTGKRNNRLLHAEKHKTLVWCFTSISIDLKTWIFMLHFKLWSSNFHNKRYFDLPHHEKFILKKYLFVFNYWVVIYTISWRLEILIRTASSIKFITAFIQFLITIVRCVIAHKFQHVIAHIIPRVLRFSFSGMMTQ